MPDNKSKQEWDEYYVRELKEVLPIITKLGFSLDENQVHMGGERYLMAQARDVGGGGKKLVLIGKQQSDGKRVIIKASSDKDGVAEIKTERNARELLKNINFAYRTFFTPDEIVFREEGGVVISVTSYINQDHPFITRSQDEQFFLALRAFETQESVHATAHAHSKAIEKTFNTADAKYYFDSFQKFKKVAIENDPENTTLAQIMKEGEEFLRKNKKIIDRYCGFLTHSDFVPNNLRVSGNEMFLLDYASIHFGNKYESWARFINFMIQHNRVLEKALTDYVRHNRSKDGFLSLRLMRVYKIGFLLQFYTNALKKTSGNLHLLVRLRITFWTNAMRTIMEDKEIEDEEVRRFVKEEDKLRSKDEMKRQDELLGGKRLV